MHNLICHPDTPSSSVSQVTAQVAVGNNLALWVEFMVTPMSGLVLPRLEQRLGKRTDDLWLTTCFEVFLKPTNDDRYFEFNLSPSYDWAAYSFELYRSGRQDHPVRFEPEIDTTPSRGSQFYWLACELPLPEHRTSHFQLGLTAVIEETGGHKSYWALAHPAGPPDFHDLACFTARLPE